MIAETMKPIQQTPYKILDNGMMLFVVDYAKRKKPEGGYDIVVFETQYLPWSNLGQILDDKDLEMDRVQNEAAITKLFGKKMRFIDSLGISRTGTAFDELHKVYELESLRLRNPLKAAIDVIYYHSLDFSMASNIIYRSRYELEPMAKEVGTNKILQRLWLFNQESLHAFLPAKIMIAIGADIADNVARLADKMIRFYGAGQKIFLKSPCEALGAGNQYFKIINKKQLIKELNEFYQQILASNPHQLFLIETASTIAQSEEKQRVDTYRAALAVTMNGASEKPSTHLINLWKFIAKNKELDSHEYHEVQYYAETKPCAYSFETRQRTQLAPKKIAKHLNLQQSKPDLFAAMSHLGLSFAAGDLDEMASKIFTFDKAPAKSKMVASSVLSQKALVAYLSKCAKIRENWTYSLSEMGCRDPIQRVIARSKTLEPGRDWELIAKAATRLLQSDHTEEYVFAQMETLVGVSKTAAETTARHCLTQQSSPSTREVGFFGTTPHSPKPRQSICPPLPSCTIL